MTFVKAAKMLASDLFTRKNSKSDCHHICEIAVRKTTLFDVQDDRQLSHDSRAFESRVRKPRSIEFFGVPRGPGPIVDDLLDFVVWAFVIHTFSIGTVNSELSRNPLQ